MKKIFALVLVLGILLTLFTACASKEDDVPETSNDPSANPSIAGTVDPDEDELTEINIRLTDTGYTGSGSKVKLIEDAINEITEREIGVHLNFTWIQNADYGTQLTLSVANSEPVDVAMYVPPTAGSFLTYYTNGALMDITDLAAEYGQDICALLGEDILATTTIDGRLYGFSTYRILNSNMYICIRTDVLEQIGMVEEARNMTKWSEYEAIMQAIVDNGIPMAAVGNASNGHGLFHDPGALYGYTDDFSGNVTFDILGDSSYLIYTDQDGNVELLQGRPEYIAQCEMTKKWNDNGYVWADSAFSINGSESMIAASVFASYIVQSEYGVETNKSQSCATDMTCVEIAKSYLSTTQGQKFGMVIPESSSEPVAAMKFINLLYTNEELMNTIIWGIEGETYVINESGEASYPEGTDISTCGYHYLDFFIGNQFATAPWAGSGADFRIGSLENFLAAPKSAYMGCTVDTSSYDNIYAAVSAVVDEYNPSITSGMYTESYYNEFMSKLDAAGASEWIAIYQAALDDFLA